jgi:hypothetical protein
MAQVVDGVERVGVAQENSSPSATGASMIVAIGVAVLAVPVTAAKVIVRRSDCVRAEMGTSIGMLAGILLGGGPASSLA